MGRVGFADAGAEGGALGGVVGGCPGRAIGVAGGELGQYEAAAWEGLGGDVPAAGEEVAGLGSLGLDFGVYLRCREDGGDREDCAGSWIC